MRKLHCICLIEDEPIMGESLVDRFELEGFHVDWFRDGEKALDSWVPDRYALVISDVRLPGQSGEDVFKRLSNQEAYLPPFVFITAFATVNAAVNMLKLGAADYVTKPFDIGELVEKVQRLVGTTMVGHDEGDATLGPSAAMRRLVSTAPRVAQRGRVVLIAGESGVGKEVLAAHLHALADPANEKPFIAVNCGAIPETLLESEFFGHERGAFTGADRAHKGLLEQSDGGTLFLDEIADLPLGLQVKLLRVLQEQKVQRLGAERSERFNSQLICATNRDLRSMVASGQFREDLYYRINVIRLTVPPLRERLADVLWLARRFLAEQADRLHEPQKALDAAAQAALIAYPWPGNVRELKNRIERACVYAEGSSIGVSELFEDRTSPVTSSEMPTLEEYLGEAEKAFIQSALSRHHGKVGVTASALGVSRKTLWEKTKRLGLRVDEAADHL